MAVTFTYGTIGSGKTYSAVCRILDELQDGLTVATINMRLKPEAVRAELIRRGLSAYEARKRAGNVEQIFTQARFRELSNVKLHADEAHFWWPQNQYKRIDFEDILTAAMSRKRRVDIHIISQLDKSVNLHIRDLAMESWLSRPVTMLSDGLKLLRRLGLGVPPMLFEQVRMESFEGGPQRRKDGSISAADKRFIWLRPSIAACYDTLEEVSSPTLDELRENSRQQRLLAVAKGEVRPQAVCPMCKGQRVAHMLRIPVEKDGAVTLELVPYCEEMLMRNVFAKEWTGDCPGCDGRGYVYDPDHEDYEHAAQLVQQLAELRMREGSNARKSAR